MKTLQGVLFTLAILWTLANASYKITYLHVVSEIDYRFSRTIVTSKITNNNTWPEEILFDIDLPEEAFISTFKLTVRGKDYHGKIKEREVARQEFEQAQMEGRTAGHIVARPRSTNSFQVQLNVAPLEQVRFELTYRELLRRVKGFYNHVIFLSPGQPVEDFLVTVMITESGKINPIKIPPLQTDLLVDGPLGTNDLATVEFLPTGNQAIVTYQPNIRQQVQLSEYGLSGKFIVQYDIERDMDAGQILVMDGYFVHYCAPDLPPIPTDIVFIFDKSGSMLGRKMSQLQAALFRILDDVKPDDRILMLSFASKVYSWKIRDGHRKRNRGLAPATPNNIEDAKRYIRNQVPFGGTNINRALVEGFREFNTNHVGDRPAMMIFLTDGNATIGERNPERILQNVVNANSAWNIPIFTLAFGKFADYDLAKQIAARNFGFARKIFEQSDATLQITGFYDEISSILLEDVDFKYLDGSLYSTTVTDQHFENYFKGTELVVSGRVDDLSLLQQGMTITAKRYNASFSLPYPPNQCTILPSENQGLPPGQRHPGMMEKLWAYLTIKQLLGKRERTDVIGEVLQLEKEIIKKALMYQFVTPLTSMIVTLPDQQQVEPCTCGAIPRSGGHQGVSNLPGGPVAPPPPFPPPGQPFGTSFIDQALGGVLPKPGFPIGAFAKKKGRGTVTLGSDSGASGPKKTKASSKVAPVRPEQPVRPPPVQAGSAVSATSPAPAFVIKPSRGTDSICFNLPLAPNSKYNFLNVETDKRRSTSYIFTATMGQNSVDAVRVDRKMRWGGPRALKTVKKNDGTLYDVKRGVDVKLYGQANGVVTYFVEIPKKWTQKGLLTELSKLQFTITKNGGTATVSISNGPTAETATARQITYNSQSNAKCWFIQDLNTASLGVNVDSFRIP